MASKRFETPAVGEAATCSARQELRRSPSWAGAAKSAPTAGRQPVDGVLGSVVFERMVVEHDYVHRTLTFTPPEEYRYTGSGMVLAI